MSLTSSSSRLSGQSSSSSISTLSARKRNHSQDIKEKLSLDIQKKIGNRQLKTVNENSSEYQKVNTERSTFFIKIMA